MPAPLVVACLRYADLRPDVDPLTGTLTRDAQSAGLAAADAAALEHALRIAEAWAGRVLAVTAGPPAADDALRQARALAADVLRIPWPRGAAHGDEPDSDPLGGAAAYLEDVAGDERELARALAAAISSSGEPALVVCGDRSADRGTGALPALLAHELQAAQALGLVELRPEGDGLVAERRLDGGRRERLRVPRPAVCSVEAAGVRLRRASLPATLSAGRDAIPLAAVDRPGPRSSSLKVTATRAYSPRARVILPPAGATPRDRLLALTGALVAHEPPTIVEPADAAEAADVLLDFLTRHGYLKDGIAGRPATDAGTP